MKLSQREQWMIAIAAPALAAVFAELLLLQPLRKQADDLTRAAAAQGAPAARVAQLQQTQAGVENLRGEIDALRTRMEASHGRPDHSAALKEISRLCEASGVSLISSAQENQTFAPVLQPAVPLLAGRSGGIGPEAWRIDVQGSYPQVHKLLAALAVSKAWIVPLHMGMKMDEEGHAPTVWSLTLWL